MEGMDKFVNGDGEYYVSLNRILNGTGYFTDKALLIYSEIKGIKKFAKLK